MCYKSKMRTAIIVSCSRIEADQVRLQSRQERRTMSGYVLNVVMRFVAIEEMAQPAVRANYWYTRPRRELGPRTTFLVRCNLREAIRIKSAASIRRWTVSAYVLHALQKSWLASKMIPAATEVPGTRSNTSRRLKL